MVVWIVLLVGLVYLLARMWSRGGPGSHSPGGDSAREIARRRYARGEIDRQEYERILEDLAKS
ncbi:MAG: SHOCT domain-containing protein [Candidatus Fermentibacteraceae bacterium]